MDGVTDGRLGRRFGSLEERAFLAAKAVASLTPAVGDSPITFREEVLMTLAIRAMRMEMEFSGD